MPRFPSQEQIRAAFLREHDTFIIEEDHVFDKEHPRPHGVWYASISIGRRTWIAKDVREEVAYAKCIDEAIADLGWTIDFTIQNREAC